MSSGSELAGIEVVHGLEEFQESGEQILVLKDSTILENEGTLSFTTLFFHAVYLHPSL